MTRVIFLLSFLLLLNSAQAASPDQLADEALALIQDQNFDQAEEVLGHWLRLEGDDPRIQPVQELISRLRNEPDSTKRRSIISDFSTDMVSILVNRMNVLAKDYDALYQETLAESQPKEEEIPMSVTREARHSELMQAIWDRDIARIHSLLDAGSNPNTSELFGDTVMTHVTATGDVEILQMLLEHEAKVNQVGLLGFTPLMHAASAGHEETVKILLDQGAEIWVKNDYGQTALSLAKNNKHRQITKLLTAAGAKG